MERRRTLARYLRFSEWGHTQENLKEPVSACWGYREAERTLRFITLFFTSSRHQSWRKHFFLLVGKETCFLNPLCVCSWIPTYLLSLHGMTGFLLLFVVDETPTVEKYLLPCLIGEKSSSEKCSTGSPDCTHQTEPCAVYFSSSPLCPSSSPFYISTSSLLPSAPASSFITLFCSCAAAQHSAAPFPLSHAGWDTAAGHLSSHLPF